MGAYNVLKQEFVDGQVQIRFYKTPVKIREYMHNEKSKIESDRIDKKITDRANLWTPYGHADCNLDDIKEYTELELALRHERSVKSSINRTKSMIYNYARGNVWDWFITLTFDSKKIDRYDYKECSTRLRKWLNNMKNKYAKDMKYLIIPEQHKDGAWHFHGLLSNCDNMKFDKAFNKHTGELLVTKNDLQIYNFGNYKLGFSTATPIEDTAKASSYITKYVTKQLAENTLGHRRYYPSSNLDLPPKTYFFLDNDDKKKWFELVKNRITYRKDVVVKIGSYEQIVRYMELSKSN